LIRVKILAKNKWRKGRKNREEEAKKTETEKRRE
jgi:hypothetical protein